MCGIVGAARFEMGGLMDLEFRAVEQLLVVGSLRGTHGTGLVSVTEKGDVGTMKIGSDPHALMKSELFQKQWPKWKKKNMRIVLGHNRLATTGKHTTEHAHPFRHGHITMVHNGTLEKSECNMPELKKYDVDSEALCVAIAERGVKEAIAGAAGAWAIVYYDSKEETLNFLRNYERSLYIQMNKGWSRLLWASEREMLDLIVKRNGIAIADTFLLPANTLHTVHLHGKGDKLDYTTEEIKGKEVIKPTYHGVGSSLVDLTNADWSGWSDEDIAELIEEECGGNHKHGQAGISKAPINLHSVKAGAPTGKKSQEEKGLALLKGPTENTFEIKRVRTKTGTFVTAKDYVQPPGFAKISLKDIVTFRLDDYKEVSPVDKDTKRFLVTGKRAKVPNVPHSELDFLFYLNGQKAADTLMESGFVQATVRSIMLDCGLTAKSADEIKDIIWVSHPVPVWDSLGQSVNLV